MVTFSLTNYKKSDLIHIMNNHTKSNLISWDRKEKIGVTEISILEHNGVVFESGNPILSVKSVKTEKIQPFHFSHVDWADPSHEDIAGWNYHTLIDGELWKLLIIND